MAYLGKEFKFEKDENVEGFFKSLGLPPEDEKKFLNYKPNIKLTKNGDNYTISLLGEGGKDTTFTPGKQFQEEVGGLQAQSIYTVEGDTITQLRDFGAKGKLTIKRIYSPNQLVVEMTSSNWDGVARRYYTA